VPAAAVIPAPRAYIKVVVAKKLVVGFWEDRGHRRGTSGYNWVYLEVFELGLVLGLFFLVVGPYSEIRFLVLG